MDDLTALYADLEAAISALRALDASGALTDAAAADVAATLDALRREAEAVSEAIDAETEQDATPDLDPMTWERRAA